MNGLPFSSEDLINYIFGSGDARNEMMLKIIRVLDAKLDAQLIEWRKLYDKYGETKFMSAIASEFARQDADAIRGVCLSLLMKQVRAVKIDAEGTDSGGTGDTPNGATDK